MTTNVFNEEGLANLSNSSNSAGLTSLAINSTPIYRESCSTAAATATSAVATTTMASTNVNYVCNFNNICLSANCVCHASLSSSATPTKLCELVKQDQQSSFKVNDPTFAKQYNEYEQNQFSYAESTNLSNGCSTYSSLPFSSVYQNNKFVFQSPSLLHEQQTTQYSQNTVEVNIILIKI